VDTVRSVLVEMLRDLTTVSPRTVRLVMALVIACGCWVVVARSRSLVLAWLALVVSSLVWLRVDQREEGRVLFVVTAYHGVTQADLLVPAVAGIAVVLRAVHLAMRGHMRRRAARD
jgi:hypothetical protein